MVFSFPIKAHRVLVSAEPIAITLLGERQLIHDSYLLLKYV